MVILYPQIRGYSNGATRNTQDNAQPVRLREDLLRQENRRSVLRGWEILNDLELQCVFNQTDGRLHAELLHQVLAVGFYGTCADE